jgi:hypothetical protein
METIEKGRRQTRILTVSDGRLRPKTNSDWSSAPGHEVRALVPSMQLAEIRRASLQTRVDALVDELPREAGAQDAAHQAYLVDVDVLDAAVLTYWKSRLTAAQKKDLPCPPTPGRTTSSWSAGRP